jgi:hypothetical protein
MHAPALHCLLWEAALPWIAMITTSSEAEGLGSLEALGFASSDALFRHGHSGSIAARIPVGGCGLQMQCN